MWHMDFELSQVYGLMDSLCYQNDWETINHILLTTNVKETALDISTCLLICTNWPPKEIVEEHFTARPEFFDKVFKRAKEKYGEDSKFMEGLK